MNHLARWSSLLLVTLLGTHASTQSLTPVHPSQLERVDEGVEDVDPLLMGRVNLQVDLRTPHNFEGLYRLPGINGGPERYVRFSGGLAAVFERSDYVGPDQALVAVAPPGTVFYLGGVPMDAPADELEGPVAGTGVRLDAPSRFDHRVESASQTTRTDRVDLRVSTEVLAEPRRVGRITQDSAYRSDRVRELLRAAATRNRR